MSSIISMKQLLEAGVHFGHQTRRWNPKMAPYIYTERNGIHIIDLQKSVGMVDTAYRAVADIASQGGTLLFVGTKKQAQDAIREAAEKCGMYYVNQRWLGGTLTNFRTIQKSVKKLIEIEEMEASGTLAVYKKKEQSVMLKRKERLENFLGGIKEMKKLPDALFVVDPIEEHNAVAEARKLHIPVFALIDTNADPTTVDYPIPANDDAVRSITLMVGVIADAIVEARGTGELEFAHKEDETVEDITMKDVMINVEQQAAEYERRKRQRYEERRAQMQNRSRFSHDGQNGERRVFRRDNNRNNPGRQGGAGAPRTEAPKTEEVKAAPAAEAKEAAE